MLKKSITYTDFNGAEVTEDFYFNLTKAELIELEMGHEGGLSESLKKIVAAEDGKRIMEEFKAIILKSYGQKSADGRKFVKNQSLRDEFESTEAYSELFVSLVTDPEAAAEFVNGIMPQDLIRQAQMTMDQEIHEIKVKMEREKREDEMKAPSDEDTMDGETSWPAPRPESPYVPPAKPKPITATDAAMMDAAELQAGLMSGSLIIVPDGGVPAEE